MQDVPRCFGCKLPVEHDPIYEAPCGHEGHEQCASSVFHPMCLMQWREDHAAMHVRMDEFMGELKESLERRLMEDDL